MWLWKTLNRISKTGGYEVTGIDVSDILLKKATDKSEKNGVKVCFKNQNMKSISFDNDFDAVINIYISFGFFNTQIENLNVLKKIKDALKSNGKFLLDTVNVFTDVTQQNRTRSFNSRDNKYRSEVIIKTNPLTHLQTYNWKVFGESGILLKNVQEQYYLFTLKELNIMSSQAGLKLTKYYGDWDLSPYDFNSKRMIILFEKSS